MPLDGTLDVWALAVTTAMSVAAMVVGLQEVNEENAVLEWGEGRQALRWMGIVYAFVEATPGLLFFGCASIDLLLAIRHIHVHAYSTCCTGL